MDRVLSQMHKYTSSVRTDVRREAQRVIYETDARNYLYDRLDPPVHIGARGTWACNFQILAYLIDNILSPDHNEPTIVELGSGVSTAWLGLGLKKKGKGHLLSIEHDDHYALQTRSVVDQVGLSDVANVVLAPLSALDTPIRELTGSQHWYGLEWLDHLSVQIDFLFVDGPPSTFGSGIRGAAYPVMRSRLADGALVILDDVHRSDEQSTIDMWERHASDTGCTLTKVATVGESAVLRHEVQNKDSNSTNRVVENSQ